MPHLTDLNFGVTTWYLKPTLLARLGSALMSIILFFYLLIVASKYTDVIWKTVVGRSHAIICGFLTLSVLLVVVTFLFSYFKIFPGRVLACFYASVCLTAFYLLVVLIFAVGFVSTSKSRSYTERIVDFLKKDPRSGPAVWFVREFNVDLNNPESVQTYVNARTLAVKSALSGMSMFWLAFVAIVYFIAVFEYTPEPVDTIRYVRADEEI
jgi:small-conductance mechanosensitive channel